MSHIFISYSRKDIDFAGKIVQALAENELDTWIDWKSIPKGEDWLQEIYHGIEEADAFLFLISTDSVISEPCNLEIAHAVKNGKRILPVFITNVDNKDVYNITAKFIYEEAKKEINRRNFIFCREENSEFEKAIDEIKETIQTDYKWLKYHTELQVKALRWDLKTDNSRLLRGKELREAEEKLAGVNIQKEPQPTELHRNYLLASQRNEVKQRRQVTLSLSIGLIIVAVLAFFAWIQRNSAVAEKKRAEEQAQIALSRQLAAQALLVQQGDPVLIERSMLLGIEAKTQSQKVGLQPLQANQVLHQGLNLLPKVTVQTEVTDSDFPNHAYSGFTFSSDNHYAIVADEYIRSINLYTNEEYSPIDYKQRWKAVSFSSDGSYAATVNEKNLIQIWDLSTGKELARIPYDQDIYHIYFGSGRKYIIAQTPMRNQIWDLSSNGDYIPLDTLPSLSGLLSWDGKYLIDELTEEVRVWSMSNGQEVSSLMLVGEGGLYNLDISSGSKYIIAYYPFGRTVTVWQLADGKEIMQVTMSAAERSSTPFVFSPDERYLAVISNDQTVRVWDILSGDEILRINISPVVNAPAFGVVRFYDLAFSQDGQYLVVTGDNIARVYRVPGGEEFKRIVFEKDDTRVFNPVFSSDGRYLALVSKVGIWRPSLSIWDLGNSTNIDSVEGWVNFINISSDGEYIAADIATASEQETILQINNTTTGNEIIGIKKPGDGFWNSLFSPGNMQIISPNGLYAAIRSKKNTIQIYEIKDGQQIAKIVSDNTFNSYYVFSQDNRHLRTAEEDETSHIIKTWDIQTGELISSIRKSTYTDDILLSPDGNHFLAYENIIRFDNGQDFSYLSVGTINEDKEVSRIDLDVDLRLHNILFGPNGRLIAGIGYFSFQGTSTKSSRYIYVWDAMSGKTIAELTLERDARGIAVSHDGKYLAVALIDGTYRVWELDSLAEITRNPNKGRNFFITFTSDSGYLATIESRDIPAINSYESVINLVPLRPENEACKYLNRNLTEEEWNQYLYWIPFDPEYKTCPNLPIPTK